MNSRQVLDEAARAEVAAVKAHPVVEYRQSLTELIAARERIVWLESRNPLRHKENPHVAASPEGSMNSAAALVREHQNGRLLTPEQAEASQ